MSRKMYRTRIIKMLSRIAAALVALLVFGQSALAASNNRITHHGRAVRHAPPPAAFALPDATPSHAVKPFTAEEKGWFDRASRVFWNALKLIRRATLSPSASRIGGVRAERLEEYRDAVFPAGLLDGTRIVVEGSVPAQFLRSRWSGILDDDLRRRFVTAIFQHR
jgi:hypothetical protein